MLWQRCGEREGKKNASSEISGRLPEGNDTRHLKSPSHHLVRRVTPENAVMPAQPDPLFWRPLPSSGLPRVVFRRGLSGGTETGVCRPGDQCPGGGEESSVILIS